MFATNSANSVFNTLTSLFIPPQISFSTANFENSILYALQHSPAMDESLMKITFLVVNGEMYLLNEGNSPLSVAPLTPQSGLFRIAGLVQ